MLEELPVKRILAIFTIGSALLAHGAVPDPANVKKERPVRGIIVKGADGQVYEIREWKVPPDIFVHAGSRARKQGATGSDGKTAGNTDSASDFLACQGVTFNGPEFAMYSPASQTLVVKNTPAVLDKIDALVKAHLAKAKTGKAPRSKPGR
jgi:hypothetical protein